tara:strand:+ start:2180 stop:2872 length:693 start_codon:yes stop_codon:yes gene_type:complete
MIGNNQRYRRIRQIFKKENSISLYMDKNGLKVLACIAAITVAYSNYSVSAKGSNEELPSFPFSQENNQTIAYIEETSDIQQLILKLLERQKDVMEKIRETYPTDIYPDLTLEDINKEMTLADKITADEVHQRIHRNLDKTDYRLITPLEEMVKENHFYINIIQYIKDNGVEVTNWFNFTLNVEGTEKLDLNLVEEDLKYFLELEGTVERTFIGENGKEKLLYTMTYGFYP